MPSDDTRSVGGKRYNVRLIYEHSDPERAFATRFYEAWDPVLQRQVALKEMVALRQDERGRDFLTRARDEARLLAKIGEQRNLPLIYDVVEEKDRTWLVMEFVKGPALSDLYLRPDAQPPARDGVLAILDVALDVCRALQTLHQHRIAHRDIAPANIMVGKRGAKLVDVGLAVWPSRRAYEAWETGEGTRGYRAPEQTAWRGPLTIPGPASDVYSLGAVLYRLLTASPLPPLPPGAQPPPLSRANPAVPPVLDELVVAALAHAPKERPGLGRFYQRLRAIRDTVRDAPAEAERFPAAVQSVADTHVPAATSEETVVTEERQSILQPETGASSLAERYNEGIPEPPPFPTLPPSPRAQEVSLPSHQEQTQARRTLLIVAGVIAACVAAIVGCAALGALLELVPWIPTG
jgi:serine/threonine protein kinase